VAEKICNSLAGWYLFFDSIICGVVKVKAFKKLRYKIAKVGDISSVVTLPYDIITAEKQKEYYRQSPYSFVRLILPKDEASDMEGDKYLRVKKTLDEWMRDGILVEDAEDAIYIYEQDYWLGQQKLKQAGIICLVKVEPFEKGEILPHERVLEKPLKDRLKILEATEACLEPIIALLPDTNGTAAGIMTEYRSGKPQLDFLHDDDIRHRVWKITDEKDMKKLMETLSENKLIIADGHHRYTTFLRYYQEKKSEEGYIMMLLWIMDDSLCVLPTHRLIKNMSSGRDLLDKIKPVFEITQTESLKSLFNEMKTGGKKFGLYDGRYHILTLKDEKSLKDVKDEGMSDTWNALDVNILQNLIITKLMGTDYQKATYTGDLTFIKDAKKAVMKVDSKEYDALFLMNPPNVDTIYEIAKNSERMPQKSTYFYPKPLSGILMAKI
jgi:uncharacterized protein (DUF1015 family)